MQSQSTASPRDEMEDEWTHFEDLDQGEASVATFPTEASRASHSPLDLPANLHPAVSLGVRRVSSCYFSLDSSHSRESVADLLSQFGEETSSIASADDISNSAGSRKFSFSKNTAGADVLYHDILMHVLSYLDAPSLAAFSETARRPNFEVFYFLQLQLQGALLVEEEHQETSSSSSSPFETLNNLPVVSGTSRLSRLAKLDRNRAQSVVDEYIQSNSTLKTMPLSHSLAYFRQVLQRNGFLRSYHQRNPDSTPTQTLASAALFVTIVGAAVMTGSTAADTAAFADSFGTELPNMLFRVGFVGSALMATRKMSTEVANNTQNNNNNNNNATMRETAEQMARALHDLPGAMMRGEVPEHFRIPSLMDMRRMLFESSSGARISGEQNIPLMNAISSSSPYDHETINENDEKSESEADSSTTETRLKLVADRKVPTGSVGAYTRAVSKAADIVTTIIKEGRKARFLAMPQEEQRQLSLAFLDACASDDTLWLVKEMVHTMDVDGFYIASDGNETCALHAAAFHGAAKVLDFLCKGVDFDGKKNANGRDSKTPPEDGGLCDLKVTDGNGWTALHFAAGSNAVQAVEILGSHGAPLSVQANNGYTPLQWALRLSNEQAAEKLKELLAENEAEQSSWMSRQPLSQIANRFFAMIPTH